MAEWQWKRWDAIARTAGPLVTATPVCSSGAICYCGAVASTSVQRVPASADAAGARR